MECPYCGAELVLWDYFQKGLGATAVRQGDIYICPNAADESCDSAAFNGHFYTLDREGGDTLHEGFPC